MHVTTPRLVSSGSVRLVAISLGFFVGRLMQTIEDIILRHSARGMTRLVSELPCDFCAEAAREIASWPRDTVALLTGFDVGGSLGTDGPAGTYVVAKALIDLGFLPIVVSEHPTCAYFSELGVKTCEVSPGCDAAFMGMLLDTLAPRGAANFPSTASAWMLNEKSSKPFCTLRRRFAWVPSAISPVGFAGSRTTGDVPVYAICPARARRRSASTRCIVCAINAV